MAKATVRALGLLGVTLGLAQMGCDEATDSSSVDSPTLGFDCECKSPTVCVHGECQPPGAPVTVGELGERVGSFGVETEEEASPVAPSSLAATKDGSAVYVLDQVNRRIQVFTGDKEPEVLALSAGSAAELRVLRDGKLLVLDRARNSLQVLDKKGEPVGASAIEGAGVSEAGDVTGVHVRPSGVWLEVRNFFVMVLSPSGEPVQRRRMLTGLLSRSERYLLSVELLGDGSVYLNRRNATGKPEYQKVQLHFDRAARTVASWDTDEQDRTYLVTHHQTADGTDEALLTVLSPTLEQEQELPLTSQNTARDFFRNIEVTAQGIVLELDMQDSAVALRRHR